MQSHNHVAARTEWKEKMKKMEWATQLFDEDENTTTRNSPENSETTTTMDISPHSTVAPPSSGGPRRVVAGVSITRASPFLVSATAATATATATAGRGRVENSAVHSSPSPFRDLRRGEVPVELSPNQGQDAKGEEKAVAVVANWWNQHKEVGSIVEKTAEEDGPENNLLGQGFLDADFLSRYRNVQASALLTLAHTDVAGIKRNAEDLKNFVATWREDHANQSRDLVEDEVELEDTVVLEGESDAEGAGQSAVEGSEDEDEDEDEEVCRQPFEAWAARQNRFQQDLDQEMSVSPAITPVLPHSSHSECERSPPSSSSSIKDADRSRFSHLQQQCSKMVEHSKKLQHTFETFSPKTNYSDPQKVHRVVQAISTHYCEALEGVQNLLQQAENQLQDHEYRFQEEVEKLRAEGQATIARNQLMLQESEEKQRQQEMRMKQLEDLVEQQAHQIQKSQQLLTTSEELNLRLKREIEGMRRESKEERRELRDEIQDLRKSIFSTRGEVLEEQSVELPDSQVRNMPAPVTRVQLRERKDPPRCEFGNATHFKEEEEEEEADWLPSHDRTHIRPLAHAPHTVPSLHDAARGHKLQRRRTRVRVPTVSTNPFTSGEDVGERTQFADDHSLQTRNYPTDETRQQQPHMQRSLLQNISSGGGKTAADNSFASPNSVALRNQRLEAHDLESLAKKFFGEAPRPIASDRRL